jgi:hypothetical protein
MESDDAANAGDARPIIATEAKRNLRMFISVVVEMLSFAVISQPKPDSVTW